MSEIIGNHHDYSIDNGKADQDGSVAAFFVKKTDDDTTKKKNQSINCRKHMKSLRKTAFQNQEQSTLRSASEAFYAKQFFVQAG